MSIPLFPAEYLQITPFTSKSDAEAQAVFEKQRGNDCFIYRADSVDLFDTGGTMTPIDSARSLRWVVVLWR